MFEYPGIYAFFIWTLIGSFLSVITAFKTGGDIFNGMEEEEEIILPDETKKRVFGIAFFIIITFFWPLLMLDNNNTRG